MKIRPPVFLRLAWLAMTGWSKDNVPRLGASLAYYTLFAVSPILVIAIAIAGSVFGEEAVRGRIVSQIDNGVASYTILNEDELKDRDRAKAKVKAEGFDGAILTRVASVLFAAIDSAFAATLPVACARAVSNAASARAIAACASAIFLSVAASVHGIVGPAVTPVRPGA